MSNPLLSLRFDKLTITKLFTSFCLSPSGCCLWSLSCPHLEHLEVSFNNILRKIWGLPRRCHTSILHLTTALDSLFNVIYDRSMKLLLSAISSDSAVLQCIFSDCSKLAYTFAGYNFLYSTRHLKFYLDQDCFFSNFFRDLLTSTTCDSALLTEFHHLCCN